MPNLLKGANTKPVHLALARNLVRDLKRGHPWVYRDALKDLPAAAAGSPAVLSHGKRAVAARGYYDPQSPLAFRSCAVDDEELDETWAIGRLNRALDIRRRLFTEDTTTAYRVLNGEGDGVPGLILDRYGDYGVMQLDGAGPEGFWNAKGIAGWAVENLGLKHVIQKPRTCPAVALAGKLPQQEVAITEDGVKFFVDLINGQKTGFFLDQRENRKRIGELSAGRTVLNLFGYTGGFSVYAGLGGAAEVATVDIAKPAVAAAERNWKLNGLNPAAHSAVASDAFEFLKNKRIWDIVVADPPSFAPSKDKVPQAKSAYTKLIEAAAGACKRGGLLAVSSCSSHIPGEMFLELCVQAVSQARRRATVLSVYGQPPDHPYPLACPELRYLKFVLLAV
ncbi:MAG: class I SAM-dependent rRNA methyltransferase [Elusimicrobiota bacterium]